MESEKGGRGRLRLSGATGGGGMHLIVPLHY